MAMSKERRDELIQAVLPWLKQCEVRPVHCSRYEPNEAVSTALNTVISRSTRATFQEAKALKHRNQIESMASLCLQNFTGDLVVELGAGQGILGQTISLASKCPLVAIDRRGNTDAFDTHLDDTGLTTETHRIQAEIANFTEDQLSELPEAKHIAVVAKHLCGHGSDEALTLAMKLGEKLDLLCLAPCCHVTMKWDQLCADTKKWLSEAGFPGGMQEFDLLIDALRLARGGPNACIRWHLRDAMHDDVELGHKVRRILDEARLARLESHGFRVAAVEYCSKDISPDNVLLLAVPPTSSVNISSSSLGSNTWKFHLLVEVDPAASSSLIERLAAYFLALKASEEWPLLSVTMDSPIGGCAKNTLFRTTEDLERLHQLMRQLAKDVILQRVVTRFLPLSERVEHDMTKLTTAVFDRMASASAEPHCKASTLRILAKPRNLERTICELLPQELLSPTHFSHVLTVADACDAFYFSISPRQRLDPAAWSEACKVQDERALLRFQEVLSRWPRRFKGKTAAALWTDLVRPKTESFLQQCCDLPVATITSQCTSGRVGAADPVDVKLNPLRGNWFRSNGAQGVHQTLAVDLLLVDIGSTEKEAVVALRHFIEKSSGSTALAADGTAILRLRCGRRPNAVKKWLRETVKHIEDLGFCRVELLHLLVDRENERTAVFDWTGAPLPQYRFDGYNVQNEDCLCPHTAN